MFVQVSLLRFKREYPVRRPIYDFCAPPTLEFVQAAMMTYRVAESKKFGLNSDGDVIYCFYFFV